MCSLVVSMKTLRKLSRGLVRHFCVLITSSAIPPSFPQLIIETKYHVQTYGIHADFFMGLQAFQEIEEALQESGLEVGVLGVSCTRQTVYELY